MYKTGTGNFTVTFTTAMPDANYAITFGAGLSTSVMAITDPTGNNLSNPLRCYLTILR